MPPKHYLADYIPKPGDRVRRTRPCLSWGLGIDTEGVVLMVQARHGRDNGTREPKVWVQWDAPNQPRTSVPVSWLKPA
jgi:hypothetical protein